MKKLTLFFYVASAMLMFSGCYKAEVAHWDVLIIKEGKHVSKPYDLTWNDNVNIAYKWEFTESCKYELGDSDQCDWNKLQGYSFNFLTNHENSLMIGWRWDRSGRWLVAPYYNLDGETFWASAICTGDDEPEGLLVDPNLIALEINEGMIFETHFTIRSDLKSAFVTIRIPSTNEASFFQLDLPDDNEYGNTREIYPYFGGNRTAPHDVKIRRCLMDVE